MHGPQTREIPAPPAPACAQHPTRLEHLRRVSAAHAAAVLVLHPEGGGAAPASVRDWTCDCCPMVLRLCTKECCAYCTWRAEAPIWMCDCSAVAVPVLFLTRSLRACTLARCACCNLRAAALLLPRCVLISDHMFFMRVFPAAASSNGLGTTLQWLCREHSMTLQRLGSEFGTTSMHLHWSTRGFLGSS